MTSAKLTPVMQQYLDIKRRYEDAVLFFRLGDFYEMFFEDAERASELLDIALTSRNRNDEHPIPMCGVPYHSARGYIAKLLEAGVKVAICEQMELPRRGIARREVTRVITPGTTLDEESLAPDRSNFLACVSVVGSQWALAWADFSTGEVAVTELPECDAVEDELARLSPSELLLAPAVDGERAERLARAAGAALVSAAEDRGGEGAAVLSVPDEAAAAGRAAVEILGSYLSATQPGATGHLRPAEYVHSEAFVRLDRATCRNLELVESSRGKRKGSLLAVVDEAVTPMGKRLLREWLLRPLARTRAIGDRLDAVQQLVEDAALRMELRERLRRVGDFERLGGRVGARTASPRDLGRLADALAGVQEIVQLFDGHEVAELLARAVADLDPLPELVCELGRALVDEPPAALGRGPVIRSGYHEEVDRLRAVSAGGKDWMAEFESSERRRTGIATLKIGYNKVFGYFIEVSRAARDRVPSEYERKQTLANAERYITADLKQREAEVLGAEERLASLERHLFEQLVERCSRHIRSLAGTAAALAKIDVLAGLAETAHRRGYVRPRILRDGELSIEEGRHPVVESVLGPRFVPNDCRLGGDAPSLLVITGPNMAGKSTYLRQVALVVLLAHCGSFVPAAAARIPLVDRIFTRIGASDDLVSGQSTFMVEMTETATILRNMSERSLVVLDEIGRGTSTFDGVSIAWAVAEAMVARRVKTLFATHYHELAALADEHEAVANFSVAVRRYRGEVIFLHRVVEGATSGSYGIEVARLAGVPEDVIESARRMLSKFERGEHLRDESSREIQPGLFDPVPVREDPIRRRLAEIDVDALTPLQALNLLAELVGEARRGQ